MFLCEREVFRKESEKQVNLVNFLAQSISLFFILTLILKLVSGSLGRLWKLILPIIYILFCATFLRLVFYDCFHENGV